jgi:hypothetical protein
MNKRKIKKGQKQRNSRRTLKALLLLIALGLTVLLYNPIRTLTSLKKVDDYPVFVMEYQGGYLFEYFLKVGVDEDIASKFLDATYPDTCTCFAALNTRGDMIFGRNFDWNHQPTLVLFTDPPDGYASVSMVDIYYLGYGTKRFGWMHPVELLFAPYIPFDGMNEAGLSVGVMGVSEAQYNGDPQKVTITAPHAIRLLLDYAEDVDEAISLLQNYNSMFWEPPSHYLISDASGDSVIVEFIDNEMKVIRNERPWQVATNFLISEDNPEGATSPCWRYNRVYQALSDAKGDVSGQEAMSILESVSNSHTRWSAVYNMGTGNIELAVGRNYDRIYNFELEMAK